VPDKLDHHKLLNAVDFVQGFIRPVTVVYEETIEREAAVVNGRQDCTVFYSPSMSV